MYKLDNGIHNDMLLSSKHNEISERVLLGGY